MSRWKSHRNRSSFEEETGALYRAIRKYGIENFDFEVLILCNPERLNEYEVMFIDRYDSYPPPNGYNLTTGGDSNYKMSDETREKMKIAQRARCLLIHKENIHTLNAFYEAHGRHPKINSKYADDAEHRLAACIGSLRRARKLNVLDEDLYRLITNDVPWMSWDPLYDHKIQMISDVSDFCEMYGCLPVSKGERDDGYESTLAAFIISLRFQNKEGGLDEEILSTIEERLGRWFSLEPYNGTHIRKIKDLKAFVEEHGEFPHNRGIRPNEHGLHHYLVSIRQAKKNKRLSLEVDTLVEKTFGESLSWDPILDQRERTLQKIKKFIEEHGDEPKQKGTRSDEEHALGAYLSQRRNDKKIKNISDDVVSHIERVLSGFNWNTKYSHLLKPVRGGVGYDPNNYKTWSRKQLQDAFKGRGIPGGTHANKLKLIGILEERDRSSNPSP